MLGYFLSINMGINLILETMDLFLSSLTFTYSVGKKMAYNRVNNSIIKHKSLCRSQYRFCKHCSSEHALLDIVGKIQKYMDEKLFSCGIFISLRKAFNSVDHNVLPYKLHRHG